METIDTSTLNRLTTSEEKILLIDVRQPDEYAREHIPKSMNIPMEQLDQLNHLDLENKTLIFYCRSGNRTQHLPSFLQHIPSQKMLCLSGGIEQWKKSDLKVIKNKKAPLPVMRQVHLIVSLMILFGILLTYTVSPYFILLPCAAGLGLFMAGLTGWCGMAKLLSFLPYNRSTL